MGVVKMRKDLSYVLEGGGVGGGGRARAHSPRLGKLCDLGQVTWPLWAPVPMPQVEIMHVP